MGAAPAGRPDTISAVTQGERDECLPGKTTFAVHVAHVLATKFPDGQLYVNLLGSTQPLDPAEVLARFL